MGFDIVRAATHFSQLQSIWRFSRRPGNEYDQIDSVVEECTDHQHLSDLEDEINTVERRISIDLSEARERINPLNANIPSLPEDDIMEESEESFLADFDEEAINGLFADLR